jgi:deoxyribodipyrimidine photo-lyase
LKGLEEPYVHDPEEFGRRPAGYPRKIVPHKAARERALAALKTLKEG